MKNRLHRLLLFLILSSCATGSKNLVAIDSALTDVQNGKSEQGRAALDKVCTSGATGACALLGHSVSAIKPLGILQSVTSNAQSRIVIAIPHHEKLNYYVKRGDALTKLEPEHFERSGLSSMTDQVEAFGLEPRAAYDLLVIGADGMLWDKRSFTALDLNRKRARIALVSALDGSFKSEQQKMWTQLLHQRPDAIFILGDGVFPEKDSTDAVTADQLWRDYADSRESLALFKTPVLIPVVATWNDHDYGRNDGDRTYPLKVDSASIFLSYFAQKKAAPSFERGPGVASWWNAFGVHFAFLDNRSFRSPNGLDVADQTHFGEDQEQWLKDRLRSAAEPVFLASGDQFFGGYHQFESFEGSHPKRFLKALEDWKKYPVPLIFLSGDRRLSEIIKVPAPRLGYATYELTSSGLHASVPAGAFQEHPSPNQVAGADGVMNYMMVELVRSDRGFIQFDVQAFGPDKKQLYQKILTVKHQ